MKTMIISPTIRGVLLGVACVAALGLLRHKPWKPGGTSLAAALAPTTADGRPQLAIGFLPVT